MIEAQRPVLDILYPVGIHEGEGQLEIEARRRLHILDLTEADDDGLLTLVDHEDRRIAEKKQNGETDENGRKTVAHISCLPAVLRPDCCA
ncbi:hypothetical protein D3C80_1275650 [compost metagenome]